MKIGLLGGTFNPIHRCHLAIAAQTRDRLSLDRVVFIPSGDPPHKPLESLAPATHRFEMVRRAIESDPSFAISDVEVRQATKSYSIDTLRTLQEEYGPAAELFFIIGLDAFLELPSWRQAPDLLRSCHFVVVSRPGAEFLSLCDLPLLPAIERASLVALDARQQNRLDIPIPNGLGLTLLRLPPCEVSASEIRYRLKNRLGLSDLLPAPVESYIIRLGLY